VPDAVDRLRLLDEALDLVGVRAQIAAEHLDRDALADHRMDRGVDGPHPTPADALFDRVLADHLGRIDLRGRPTRQRQIVRWQVDGDIARVPAPVRHAAIICPGSRIYVSRFRALLLRVGCTRSASPQAARA
jgi:hypothetical protein